MIALKEVKEKGLLSVHGLKNSFSELIYLQYIIIAQCDKSTHLPSTPPVAMFSSYQVFAF